MTPEQITIFANDIKQVSESVKASYNRAAQLMNSNAVNDPGWASLTGAAVDQNGFIVNTSMTPLSVANAISALAQFKNYWEGQGVPAVAWGQNLEKIDSPLV